MRMMDSTKTLWHMDRVIAHYDKGERIAPVHIDMGIAKFCNIKCVFCYGIYQTPQNKYIQREPLLQTMKDAKEIGVRSIAFIGDGEPTMNPYFYEALRVGKEAGLSLACSTNGILVNTDEKLETILDTCEWMRFCLAAGTEEGYKKIHNSDKFDTVIKNMKRLVELRDQKGYDCDIGFQAVFVPNLMEKEIIEEAKLAVKLGVDYFVIKQCSLPDKGQTGMYQFDLDDYDRPEVKGMLKQCEELSNNKTKIIPKWNTISLKGKKDYEGCKAVPLLSEISGNGDWYPGGCMFGNPIYDEYKFGNLHEKSLKEIFESDRYWEIIEKMKTFDVHNSPACEGACRLDSTNKFIDDYLKKPNGVNFI